MTESPIHILLADDNVNEHFFFAHALKGFNPKIKLETLPGGIELLEYFSTPPCDQMPHIVFIDINMPLQNGKECLAAIRSDTRHDDISLVMYSTSDAETDIDETYALGADLYVRKPIEIEALALILASVIDIYEKKQLKKASREAFVLHIPE